MKKMKVTIRKDGTQKIEVLGAVGQECEEFTSEMESLLGTKEGERERKPEYYQEAEHETEVEHERGS